MTDVEKQESQKTVVAFITGLLIGGLLVWVFSATPDEKKVEKVEKETTEETVAKDSTDAVKEEVKPAEIKKVSAGVGSVSVSDQNAGDVVVLGEVSLPTESGWIVVRDYMDGNPGNVLGAARFNSEEGLVPSQVELMRKTNTGSSYQVVFYTNAGDPEFKVSEDIPVEGLGSTFKAL